MVFVAMEITLLAVLILCNVSDILESLKMEEYEVNRHEIRLNAESIAYLLIGVCLCVGFGYWYTVAPLTLPKDVNGCTKSDVLGMLMVVNSAAILSAGKCRGGAIESYRIWKKDNLKEEKEK